MSMSKIKELYDSVRGKDIYFEGGNKEIIGEIINTFKQDKDKFLFFDSDKLLLKCLSENEMYSEFKNENCDNNPLIKTFDDFLIYSCIKCLKMSDIPYDEIIDCLKEHRLVKNELC